MRHGEPYGVSKVIWTISWWVSCRPQRLGVMEEQQQKDTHPTVEIYMLSTLSNMTKKMFEEEDMQL